MKELFKKMGTDFIIGVCWGAGCATGILLVANYWG